MRYAVGSDHAGLPLKAPLIEELLTQGHDVVDLGTHGEASCHYPEFAAAVARAVSGGEAEAGLLICGTGLGMAISANKFPGIRAVVVSESFSAEMARRHNDANVLCLGARVLEAARAREVLRAWLAAGFEGGRHQLRVDMMTSLEEEARRSAGAAGSAATASPSTSATSA